MLTGLIKILPLGKCKVRHWYSCSLGQSHFCGQKGLHVFCGYYYRKVPDAGSATMWPCCSWRCPGKSTFQSLSEILNIFGSAVVFYCLGFLWAIICYFAGSWCSSHLHGPSQVHWIQGGFPLVRSQMLIKLYKEDSYFLICFLISPFLCASTDDV